MSNELATERAAQTANVAAHVMILIILLITIILFVFCIYTSLKESQYFYSSFFMAIAVIFTCGYFENGLRNKLKTVQVLKFQGFIEHNCDEKKINEYYKWDF